MALLHFEPNNLRSSLAALEPQCRVAFALACSLRAASVGTPSEPLAEAARRLARDYAYNRAIDQPAAEVLLANLEQSDELDRDDVSSSYYTLATVVNEHLESAVWAGQRAYEAADAKAQEAMEFSNYTPELEERLLQSQEVQEELTQQAADLSALQADSNAIPTVIERAQSAA